MTGVIRRNIVACLRKFFRPRLGLPTIWRLRADKRQSECSHSVEYGFVATCPMSTAVLAVSVQDVEIASGYDAVLVVVADECSKVRDHAMD